MAQESVPSIPTKLTEVKKLDENLEAFYLSDRFADVQFVVEDRVFPAHRVILASRSSYFDSLLAGSQEKIRLENVDVHLFEEILKYIYLGSVSLPEDQDALSEFLKLAQQYSLAPLVSFLTDNFSTVLNTDNVCLILNKALLNNFHGLMKICGQFIDAHIDEISKNGTLLTLTQSAIIEVIKRDAFPLSEIETFKIVEEWCEFNKNKNRAVIECVRLSLLSIDELLEVVHPSKIIDNETLLTTLKDVKSSPARQIQRKKRSALYEQTLEILELPDEDALRNLSQQTTKILKTKINLNNVSTVLNAASLYNLQDLQELCMSFIDDEAVQFIDQDVFQNLNKDSIIKLLDRDSFGVPEIKIFEAVAKWCATNNDTDYALIRGIRFALMTVQDIVSIVWDSKLVKNELLLKAIAEIVKVKEKSSTVRTGFVVGVNVASLISRTKITKNGRTIEVKLKRPYYINHINMTLSEDTETSKNNYLIQVSLDNANWKTIINHGEYICRSEQNLYFDVEEVRYIKIVGVEDNLGSLKFEAYFRNDVPVTINGIIRPKRNVATGAKLTEGSCGRIENFTINSHNAQGGVVIQLAQPYLISDIIFYLKLGSKYTLETSTNKIDWVPAISRQDAFYSSWQQLIFLERPVVFIRISCIGFEGFMEFICTHFECR